MDSSGDFFDKDRSKSIGTEFFMHTKEVDFGHFNFIAIAENMNWNTSDETNHLLTLCNSHTLKGVELLN